MITIDLCEFINVQNNVIHFYRGGYYEYTIGVFLVITNNTYTTCRKNGNIT